MDEKMDEKMDEWIDGLDWDWLIIEIDRWIDEWMKRWMDG